jgi:hypothetical protein
MMSGEYRNLLLLVQVLHNPGFRGNKLRGRNSELHEFGECGGEAANKPDCQLLKNAGS